MLGGWLPKYQTFWSRIVTTLDTPLPKLTSHHYEPACCTTFGGSSAQVQLVQSHGSLYLGDFYML